MTNTIFRIRLVGLLLAAAIVPPCIAADPETSRPNEDFGHANQDKTKSGPVGCGPTAAANGLQYLQNAYSPMYSGSHSLVPGGDVTAAANQLTDDMHTSENSGTTIEYFVKGLTDYLQRKAPGMVEVHGMMSYAWDGGSPPDGMVDNSPPTLEWLYQQLVSGQAVFLRIGNGTTVHYLTLTGLSFDDKTNLGKMQVIDPWDGTSKPLQIEGLDGATKLIDTDFTLDGKSADYVFGAVAASPKDFPPPIPEPETYAMMLAGLGILGTVVRRRKTN